MAISKIKVAFLGKLWYNVGARYAVAPVCAMGLMPGKVSRDIQTGIPLAQNALGAAL